MEQQRKQSQEQIAQIEQNIKATFLDKISLLEALQEEAQKEAMKWKRVRVEALVEEAWERGEQRVTEAVKERAKVELDRVAQDLVATLSHHNSQQRAATFHLRPRHQLVSRN